MEIEKSDDKVFRILTIYSRLCDGSLVNKADEANSFGVTERTIQRDLDNIRNFLSNEAIRTGITQTVVYNRRENGYRLEKIQGSSLNNTELLAVCKILLDSRAFDREEMTHIIKKLLSACSPSESQAKVSNLISNELFHYVEPHHKLSLNMVWDIGQAISSGRYIEVDYMRTKDKQIIHRKIKPLAIMFSEFYFYLTAFIDDENVRKDFDVKNDPFPTIYRIDRIQSYKVLKETFHIPYSSRFEEGEFRKRVQFMYGGKLRKISFLYRGTDVDAVLDRLPTAEIKSVQDNIYSITAEVFGDGIDMWLRSQGSNVELIEEGEA